MALYRSFTKSRLAFLIGYWSVMLLVVYFFIAHGDGSSAPFFVLSSWAGFVVWLLRRALHVGTGELFFESLVLYLSVLLAYYLGLIRFAAWLRAIKKNFHFLVPVSIHLGGGIAMMLISEAGNLLPPRMQTQQARVEMIRFFLASYLISYAITLIWLSVDWRLAGRAVLKRENGI
jgi:hypothetical protein